MLVDNTALESRMLSASLQVVFLPEFRNMSILVGGFIQEDPLQEDRTERRVVVVLLLRGRVRL